LPKAKQYEIRGNHRNLDDDPFTPVYECRFSTSNSTDLERRGSSSAFSEPEGRSRAITSSSCHSRAQTAESSRRGGSCGAGASCPTASQHHGSPSNSAIVRLYAEVRLALRWEASTLRLQTSTIRQGVGHHLAGSPSQYRLSNDRLISRFVRLIR